MPQSGSSRRSRAPESIFANCARKTHSKQKRAGSRSCCHALKILEARKQDCLKRVASSRQLVDMEVTSTRSTRRLYSS